MVRWRKSIHELCWVRFNLKQTGALPGANSPSETLKTSQWKLAPVCWEVTKQLYLGSTQFTGKKWRFLTEGSCESGDDCAALYIRWPLWDSRETAPLRLRCVCVRVCALHNETDIHSASGLANNVKYSPGLCCSLTVIRTCEHTHWEPQLRGCKSEVRWLVLWFHGVTYRHTADSMMK